MIRTFSGYPEISILNPRTRYFHQNVKWTIFENGHFWGCDVKSDSGDFQEPPHKDLQKSVWGLRFLKNCRMGMKIGFNKTSVYFEYNANENYVKYIKFFFERRQEIDNFGKKWHFFGYFHKNTF